MIGTMMHEIKYIPENKEFLIFFDGEEAGYLSYAEEENHWDIQHTVVFPKFRGQGLARYLVDAAVEQATKQNIVLSATCDYAEKVLARLK